MAEYNSINDILKEMNVTQYRFAQILNIPKTTVNNWAREIRKCPDYVLELIVYKLRNEGYIQ
mgnify:CR=1